MTNKELVAAGHALAKALGSDAPLTETAKLVSDLATRLDVMTVRADALAGENLALKNYIDGECYIESKRTGVYTCAGINKPETPATDAILNAVRAEGAISVRDALVMAEEGDDLYAIATQAAAQLRAGKDGE